MSERTVESVARELRRAAGGLLIDNELASIDGFKLLARYVLRCEKAALERAIAEGRRVYENIENSGPGWQAAQNGVALVGHAIQAMLDSLAAEIEGEVKREG